MVVAGKKHMLKFHLQMNTGRAQLCSIQSLNITKVAKSVECISSQ